MGGKHAVELDIGPFVLYLYST